jgi:hypothetical protein
LRSSTNELPFRYNSSLERSYQRGNNKLLEKLEKAYDLEKQKKIKDQLYQLINSHEFLQFLQQFIVSSLIAIQ